MGSPVTPHGHAALAELYHGLGFGLRRREVARAVQAACWAWLLAGEEEWVLPLVIACLRAGPRAERNTP